MLYEVSLPNAHYAIEVEDGVVIDTVPSSHIFERWSFKRLEEYVRSRCGIIEKVEE